MAQIIPGTYTARVVDWGLSKDRNGNGLVVLTFAFKDGMGNELRWNWQGSLASEKSQEIATESLLKAGFIGNEITVLADPNAKPFNDVDCEIKIELETYEGKETPRIKYINIPGESGGGIRNALDKAEAQQVVAGLNLNGMFAKKRSELGSRLQGATAEKENPDEIPF